MLVWATEIPMRSGVRASDIQALATRWLVGSPHSSWKEQDIPRPPLGEILSATKNGETIHAATVEKDGAVWAAIRYVRPEETTKEWTTEVVAYEFGGHLLVSVQVHCELLGAVPSIPKPKKPYIVRQLLTEIGAGNDGGIPIGDQPLYLREADVDLAERIVRGEFRNQLPIVYVSATWNNRPALDPVPLAQWASGIAHIVVEPSRVFSFILARNTNRQNVYGGSIGVFWPRHQGMRAVLRPESFGSAVRLATATADLVRRALLNCRPTPQCTWDFVRDLISSRRLEILRASGSKQLDAYVEAFDEDIKAKDEHIAKLEREATRLRVELQRAEGQAEVAKGGLIRTGTERPLYPAELRDAILKCLDLGRLQLFADGRCRHIVEDILKANPRSTEEAEIQDEIKRVLTTCENLGREQEKAMEALGFAFDRSGKHIEAIYHDDQRYSFTLPKTGSDWRGMKNFASDVVMKLFK